MINTIIEKWDDILKFMKDEFELTDLSYKTWLVPMKVKSISDGSLFIVASEDDKKVVDIVSKKFQDKLRIAIKTVADIKVTPIFITEDDYISYKENPSLIINRNIDPTLDELRAKSGLDSKFTFESFVPGKSNEFAHAASLAVAENPGEDYKVLYIYGGSGLGKTHLMHAIGNYILKNGSKKNIKYITSESFLNNYVNSIRNRTMDRFKEEYRSLDIFLMDDIQFLADRDGMQEEFFNTFNEIIAKGGQIVISSDRPPKEINNIADRIRTRFEGGVIADIQAPDYETRLAILRKKEEIANYNVDDEVLKYIAENIKSNIRTLEGALTKIVLKSKLEKRIIDIDSAIEILSDIINNEGDNERITPKKILNTVAEHYNLKASDLISSKKNKELSYPRQVIMYLCSKYTDATLKDIGILLGGRDHSTVSYGVDKIENDINTQNELKSDIEIIIKKINL